MVGKHLDQEILCSLLAVPFVILITCESWNIRLETRNDVYIIVEVQIT